METIECIEKREDVNPEQGKRDYGDVEFADNKNHKYPLDSEKHVRAAISYFAMPKNREKYSSEDQKTIEGKIRRAAKKFGIEMAEDKKDKAEATLVQCDVGYKIDLDAKEPPREIMYMPVGQQKIRPLVNGRPSAEPILVEVNAEVADTLQSSLEVLQAEEPRPYGDFNHESKSASFLPKKFLWKDGQGLFLEVDWTSEGRSAVKGRNYSYFSPSFMFSEGQVAGLPDGAIGALTNRPAFRKIQRIAAEQAISDPNNNDEPDDDKQTMNKVAEKLKSFELITAEQCEDQDAVVTAVVALHAELEAVQASNAALIQENTNLKLEAERIKGQEADTVIQAAISEGKIGSQDKDSISFFKAQLIASPVTTKKVLASLPINPVLKQVIQVNAGDSRAAVTDGRSKARMMTDMQNAVSEVLAANPGMSYTDAWNKAKREHKELFIEA